MRNLKTDELQGVIGGTTTTVPYYNSDGSLKGHKIYVNGNYSGFIEWDQGDGERGETGENGAN